MTEKQTTGRTSLTTQVERLRVRLQLKEEELADERRRHRTRRLIVLGAELIKRAQAQSTDGSVPRTSVRDLIDDILTNSVGATDARAFEDWEPWAGWSNTANRSDGRDAEAFNG